MRYKITFSYDGTNFNGYQIQPKLRTVQEELEKAVSYLNKQTPTTVTASGRTDKGVHANEYCVSFKTVSKIDTKKLPLALNRFLPKDVSVYKALDVPLNFHARYSCSGKEYIYKIWNSVNRNPFLHKHAFHYWYNLDIDFLNNCAKNFVGTFNFRSFCTLDNRDEKNLIRTVEYFKIYKEDNFVIFKVKANGFLYNMVRIMVGTLLMFNKDKLNENKIKDIIAAKDRSKAGPTVIPDGLYLNKVFYKGISF